ncbi:hypothetical protein ES708_31927 [subsurface metagenome]
MARARASTSPVRVTTKLAAVFISSGMGFSSLPVAIRYFLVRSLNSAKLTGENGVSSALTASINSEASGVKSMSWSIR